MASKEFESTADSVVTHLINTDNDAYVDDLDDKLREYFVKSQELTKSLIYHYGFRLVAEDFPSEDLVGRFNVYVEATRRHKDPELAIVHQLIMQHDKGSADSIQKIQKLLREISFFSAQEKHYVVSYLRAKSTGNEEFHRYNHQQYYEKAVAFMQVYGDEVQKACTPNGGVKAE
jgi:hypothetical protein